MRRSEIGRWLAGFALLAMTTGCLGRSPQVEHYVLGVEALPTPAQRGPEIAVVIGPVRLPGYLERSEFARLRPSGEVELDGRHRWLGGFERNFIRALEAGVARQLGSDRVVAYPTRAPFPIDYRVRLHVDDLILEADGTLRVRIRWALVREGDDSALALARLEERRSGVEKTPSALVRAHEQLLADLATRIVDALVAPADR